jgi:hypothetical protein
MFSEATRNIFNSINMGQEVTNQHEQSLEPGFCCERMRT